MQTTRTKIYDFRGHAKPPVVGSPDGSDLRSKITAANGSPTVVSSAGSLALTLDNTNEVQNLCLYGGDELAWDIDDLVRVWFLVKLSASLNAAVQAAWGLASSRNDAIDSISYAALFRAVGSNSLLCESDDGVNDNDDVATGQSISTTFIRTVLDFGTGVQTRSGVASLGGKAAVRFLADNGRGQLRRLAPTQLFDMSNYTGGFQPFAQLQKTASTATAALSIQEIGFDYRVGG